MSVPGSKNGFFFYFNQVIGPLQINYNKNYYFLYLILQFFCTRDRVPIFYCDIIYFAIIDTQLITAVFF